MSDWADGEYKAKKHEIQIYLPPQRLNRLRSKGKAQMVTLPNHIDNSLLVQGLLLEC